MQAPRLPVDTLNGEFRGFNVLWPADLHERLTNQTGDSEVLVSRARRHSFISLHCGMPSPQNSATGRFL